MDTELLFEALHGVIKCFLMIVKCTLLKGQITDLSATYAKII